MTNATAVISSVYRAGWNSWTQSAGDRPVTAPKSIKCIKPRPVNWTGYKPLIFANYAAINLAAWDLLPADRSMNCGQLIQHAIYQEYCVINRF